MGVPYAYPQFKARASKEMSLEEQINECFERSLNGKALPAWQPGDGGGDSSIYVMAFSQTWFLLQTCRGWDFHS